MTESAPLSDDVIQMIERIAAELDPIQMAIFRKMSPAEKGRGVADMFSAMKQMALVSERDRHPELSVEEIHRRAIARIMRVIEWEPTLRRQLGF